MKDQSENSPQDNPVSIPINDELDLHTFKPEEVKYLIPDYCKECIQKNILTVRIIHGKGTGKLREYVHAVLKKCLKWILQTWTWAWRELGGDSSQTQPIES